MAYVSVQRRKMEAEVQELRDLQTRHGELSALAAMREIERLQTALHDLTMIFASRPDIYALTGFAERPVIERARQLCNSL